MSSETAKPPCTVWKEPNAVLIHVVLEDIEPPVWRRLVVPLTITLAEFHHVLQAAMGWTDSHLHQFEIGGLCYGDVHVLNLDLADGFARAFDSTIVRLRDFRFRKGRRLSFTYEYDFGDNWRHTVTFEELLAETPAPKTAICIDGARCCPPEDVGGSYSYTEFLRVLFDPEADETDEQKHLQSWSGGKFDPEFFDLAKTDKAVRGALRKRRRKQG